MRQAAITRTTRETDISLELTIEGGEIQIDTGVGFFDHMLTAFAVHGGFGLKVTCRGDLNVDCHHTVEDIGIVLGQAFAKALGDKKGIARFGSAYVPMDEALAFCALDISGRVYLMFEGDMPQAVIGAYDTCMTEEFMRALASNAGLTLHIKSMWGKNSHHITEAMFKALARSLKAACKIEGDTVLSSKGVLA